MKKIVFFFILCSYLISNGQEKERGPFFNANIHATFALNENYVLFQPDDGELLFDFSAIFIRTGFGFQFHERIAASINFGLDFHTRFRVQAIPSYANVQYNIIVGNEYSFFINGSYGTLWKPSSNFEKGKYHSFGIGIQGNDTTSSNLVFRLDFHRKGISEFNKGNLDSLSFGIGIILF